MLELVVALVVAALVAWLILVALLLITARSRPGLSELVRLLPDTLRLLRRLASDPEVPRGAKVRLWLLFAYLAFPLDLVPDFIPLAGYADDALIVAAVLRAVVRSAGVEALERNWPGSREGLRAVARAAGLS